MKSAATSLILAAVAFVAMVARADEKTIGNGPGPEAGFQLEDGLPRGLPLDEDGREKYNAGWTLAFDNDALMSGDRDFDYTGGVAVTFAGRRAAEWPISLDRATGWLDSLVPANGANSARRFALHSLQVGLIAFTPEDLSNPAPIQTDRPYASLLFLSNARTFVAHPSQPVYETSFTLGVLGLDLAKHIQRGIHKSRDLVGPEGWDHQISDGGEPTARATWGRQSLLASNFQPGSSAYELKWRAEASAGYLTEASIAFTGRWGLINTPWWSFTPERSDYIAQAAPVVGGTLHGNVRELYVWGGVKARAIGYNVFLQGQFRESDVKVSSNDIERVVGEAWAGVTWQVSRAYRVGYAMRYQTKEIKSNAARDLLWGSVIVSRDF